MKLSEVTQALSLIASILPSAYAWGGLGHQTVAFVASNLVDQPTQDFFQNILGDSSPQYMASVATWADTYRRTKEGRFSEPFHFIDSKDKPPETCSVDYGRDCGAKGCIIEAIQNYVCFEMILSARIADTEL